MGIAEIKSQKARSSLMHHKDDFPIFSKTMNGKPLTYLDTASSAQKPQHVIDAMSNVMTGHYANIHRGLYEFSQTTTTLYEAVRGKVASFINAPSSESIIFTRNTTEAINLVAYSWAEKNLEKGDVVLLTAMEHHANIVPWQLLKERKGIEIKVLDVFDDGTLKIDELQTHLNDRVKLVSFVHVSNAIGTINPAAKIIADVKKYNSDIKTLIDATQAVVHKPVDMSVDYGTNTPDFLAFTGHKLYGPNGVGVLVINPDIIDEMPPFLGGGDMIEHVSFDKTKFKRGAARFEAGTPAITEVIGLGAAIDYISAIGMDNIEKHEQVLLQKTTKAMADIPQIKFIGQTRDKAAIISFIMDGTHISDIGMILDQQGIAIRTGHHCCMPLMERFGIDGTARISFGLYNDENDIDRLITGLHKTVKMLGVSKG